MSALQSLIEVGVEVARVLDADREPQQVGWAGRARAFDAGAMLDQALDAAERRRALPQLDARRRRYRCSLATLDPHRQHAAEAAAHLLLRDRVAGEGGQAWVEDLLDHRMRGEPLCQQLGRAAGPLHAREQ